MVEARCWCVGGMRKRGDGGQQAKEGKQARKNLQTPSTSFIINKKKLQAFEP